jgi:flagellar hook-length control protein FliK
MVLGLVSGRTRDAAASTETNLRETALGALAAADAGRQVRATRPEITPARADPAGQAADPAAEVARSTVTRDTAGTALAAAIIASSPETRPTGRRPAAQGGQAGPVAFAGAASASTPSAAAATATGSTPDAATTPPPQAGTGIAAAASAFAERVRAIAGERADAAPTTAASTTAGSGTGPASLPTSTQAAGTGSAAASLSGGGQAGATIVPQLAAEIVRRVSAGETRFQIRLDPAELGRVDVRLSLDDGGEARAQLLVERRETYDLIARDHRVLERTLREAGYEVRDGSVQVTLKQNGDSGGGHGGQNQGGAFDRMAQQQQQQHGQNPHAGNQRGDQGYPASSRPETDTVDTDLVTRLAAFAARPGPGSGRIDIRV